MASKELKLSIDTEELLKTLNDFSNTIYYVNESLLKRIEALEATVLSLTAQVNAK